jgi:hypothetical protein
MANRDSERIGRIVRRRSTIQAEQQLDHVLNLVLLGAAVAHDRALDLGRCVFDDRAAVLDRGEHRNATGVAEPQRAPGIGRVEDAFNRDAIRARHGQQRRELGMDVRKALRQVHRWDRDRTARHEMMPAPVRLDAAVTGAL